MKEILQTEIEVEKSAQLIINENILIDSLSDTSDRDHPLVVIFLTNPTIDDKTQIIKPRMIKIFLSYFKI